MQRVVFIFHGVGGGPGENWFPWLKRELKYNRCNVIVPQFPTPEGQILKNWLKTFEECLKNANLNEEDLNDAIFIGHSLGGLFMLSLLEKYKIKMAVFVASFGKLPSNKFDESMTTFAPPERADFDWRKIQENCQKFLVYQGDNDPYVKLGTAHHLARNLHAKLELLRGAGHFNGSTGYFKFPLLLEAIKKIF
ncbi:alpha/beta hydrolase [Candidatus Peregrinibacteria bacterium]|nr:alpha/beta hydrolase [Candidatus Peregrinibacteria bacterium]